MAMRFPYLMLILCVSCSTQYQKDLWREQAVYAEACRNWYEQKGQFMNVARPGEETWPVQSVMAERCQEDPNICDPPKKHPELKKLEYYWNQPETPEHCASM
jgi:hypothetical protein